jgi:5-methylcytosine-specific restriction endonuclease McrA
VSQIYKGWTPAIPKPITREKRVKLSGMKYERLRNRVFEEQDGHCAGCKKEFETVPEMDLHHLAKRKAGGGSRNDSRANVVGLCRSCHGKRESKLAWTAK